MRTTPADEFMTPAKLRVVREWLGLTGEALSQVIGVQDRTIRRWEAGQVRIPDGARLDIERVGADADAEVAALVTQMSNAADVVALTYRTNAEFWAHRPELAPFPACWHHAIVARVEQEVPHLAIDSWVPEH